MRKEQDNKGDFQDEDLDDDVFDPFAQIYLFGEEDYPFRKAEINLSEDKNNEQEITEPLLGLSEKYRERGYFNL